MRGAFDNSELNNTVLLIDKPAGRTSFDVLKEVRRLAGIKKIGHSGTLDKFATGLLVVCTGRMTRLTTMFLESDKRYRAVVRLGLKTDTDDCTGTVIEEKPVKGITGEDVSALAARFSGRLSQRPPDYSALKLGGKRASDLVRAGESVTLKERDVTVYTLDILEIADDFSRFSMDVYCSKGTYIRSLARDMGDALGTGAHLESLRRTASGSLVVEDAVTLEELQHYTEGKETARSFIKDPVQALRGYSLAVLKDSAVKKALNGAFFRQDEVESLVEESKKKYIIVDKEENFIAIADIDIDKWHITYQCVLGTNKNEK